ncbi:NAD(P)-dependent dehydrogenase, short-chain alcohol dehydrogenase family [Brevibacterium sandarakinum]|uniref:NAD(P)-dependent dehydrogenase, short-chain alcohol dehydrogenase family n=1 Tax=Brevibacterium sandarakinum TaxID=629680 RepID=A0A1H1TXP5_BRESA|nr:SDR family oxidoreductase [Brevibacterium sandarakinum]SDS64409.1 NAD(P)-dependent dehydrogenase, short-chain alcohol dehydrogenase family [Brevibacterium sandarakinum]
MDTELTGKRVFISGSTQGIGFATAAGLAAEGASVVINGRDDQRVSEALEKLRSLVPGSDVSGIAADFADPGQVEVLLEALGSVDVLVNNLGLFEVASFAEIPDAEWLRYFEVNVMSGVRLSRHLLDPMLKQGWGRIIFIGTESAVDVPSDMIHYGATKAAALALSNGLAKLTPGTDVTVNTVLGGPTYSTGVADTVEQIASAQSISPATLKSSLVRDSSLIQRFIEPDEVANLVIYLASAKSSATNGAALRADGGVLPTTV